MTLKEKPKRYRPPKMHHLHGDPRRTWTSLEKLIARQEGRQAASTEEVAEALSFWGDSDATGPFYRADALVAPIDPEVAAYRFPDFDPPPLAGGKTAQPVKLPEVRLPSAKLRSKPVRDWNTRRREEERRRSKRPLSDPFTQEGARLFARAYYRLQQLAVNLEAEIATKQAEVTRLEAEVEVDQEVPAGGKRADRWDVVVNVRTQADFSMLRSGESAQQRGPPMAVP